MGMPLDQRDGSDLSIECELHLRRQDLTHGGNELVFERRKSSPEKAEPLRNSHAWSRNAINGPKLTQSHPERDARRHDPRVNPRAGSATEKRGGG